MYISNEMGVMVVYTARVIYQTREDEKIHVMVVAVRVHARWWSSGGRNSGRMEEGRVTADFRKRGEL